MTVLAENTSSRVVSIDAEAVLARQALVFARHLLGPGVPHTEYLCDDGAPVHGNKVLRNVRMAALPVRPSPPYELAHEGRRLSVQVVDRSGEDEDAALAVLVWSGDGYGAVDGFLDAAASHCQALVYAPRSVDSTHRYVLDAGYWESLGAAPRRAADTVFLARDAQAVARHVVTFMTDPAVRQRHRRYGVPFKLNVLLHGPPGTGKTSLINSVAGDMGSDVFILRFTPKTTDVDLAMALRGLEKYNNPVIVMEDIDRLFAQHQPARNAVSLGGLLNALDGMERPEGSVVFLTTNDLSGLDPAVVRSRRVDRILRMTYADAEQTVAMFGALFPNLPEEAAQRFARACSGHSYTTSDLHAYLFDCFEPAADRFLGSLKESRAAASENRMYS